MLIDNDLAYQLKTLCSCAAKDSTRPRLQTVHIEATCGRTILVTADGFQLAAMSLPEADESFTIHVDAQSLGKLAKKGNMDITPSGVNINGIMLPDVTLYQPYPDWRGCIPRGPNPRANIGEIFAFKYTLNFLQFRLGRKYKSQAADRYGLPHSPVIMRWSVYGGNMCGAETAHAWAWDAYDVYYLYVLMPLDILASVEHSLDESPEQYKTVDDAFVTGYAQLETLLSERLSSIKSVTTEIHRDTWGLED